MPVTDLENTRCFLCGNPARSLVTTRAGVRVSLCDDHRDVLVETGFAMTVESLGPADHG